MRALLATSAPGHAVYGEEGGLTLPTGGGGATAVADYMWVVDPIDGTKSFITGERGMEWETGVDCVRLSLVSQITTHPHSPCHHPPTPTSTGKPLWGTLIALLHRGTPILGVIDQPTTKERWVGAAGRPTTLNGAPAAVRPCPTLADAYLYATTPHMFAPGRVEEAWTRVRDKARIPLYGCDCYAYGLLSSGYTDAVVEADLGPYDYLAIVPIVTGAGGVMTDWAGAPLRADWSPATGHSVTGLAREVVAAGDARVHAQIVRELAWK